MNSAKPDALHKLQLKKESHSSDVCIMKNKAGTLIGFVLGVAGFLLTFKVIFLDNIPPEDELAPGIVVFASVLTGLLFAFVGYRIQNSTSKKNS